MSIAPTQSGGESEYPRSWSWADDGSTVTGTFVEFSSGPTRFGTKPILVLMVGDERRSVWLSETALLSKIKDEVAARESRDLTPGDHVVIEKGTEKVEGGSGYSYWPFTVRFPGAPSRSAASILGIGTESAEPELAPSDDPFASPAASDDDIPF